MLYFLYACEQKFGGLHGIESFSIEEFDNRWTKKDILREYIPEMSYDVMNSSSEVMNDLYNQAEELADEDGISENRDDYIANTVYELMDENIDGYVVKIKDEYQVLGEQLLFQIICDLGIDSFVRKYCESL